MQEVAIVPLLAQPPQPVLADRVVVGSQVPQRTQPPVDAPPHAEQVAHRRSRFYMLIIHTIFLDFLILFT